MCYPEELETKNMRLRVRPPLPAFLLLGARPRLHGLS